MTRDFFNGQWARLVAAYFSQKLLYPTEDLYWEELQNISPKRFKAAIWHCLGRCKDFPTITELVNASNKDCDRT
jgi:hypothetical protein